MAKNAKIKRADPADLPEGCRYVDMGFKFRAYPTDEQLATIKETIKTCTFVWNYFMKKNDWDYDRWKEDHSNPKPLTGAERGRFLTQMRSIPKYGFREDARRDPSIADEYAYCEAVLSEHGIVDPSGTTNTSPA